MSYPHWHRSVTFFSIKTHLYGIYPINYMYNFVLTYSIQCFNTLLTLLKFWYNWYIFTRFFDIILWHFYYLNTILWHILFILAQFCGIIQWHTLLKLTQFCYKFCLPWHTSFPCRVIGLEHVSQTIKSCCQFLLDLFCNLQGQQRNNYVCNEFLAQLKGTRSNIHVLCINYM